jgi:hypothetical protein
MKIARWAGVERFSSSYVLGTINPDRMDATTIPLPSKPLQPDRNDFVSQRLVANAVTMVLIMSRSLCDEISDFLPNSWNAGGTSDRD